MVLIFHGGSVSKESAFNEGDPGSILVGKIPGEWKATLQYSFRRFMNDKFQRCSCLKGHKSQTQLSVLHGRVVSMILILGDVNDLPPLFTLFMYGTYSDKGFISQLKFSDSFLALDVSVLGITGCY